MPFDFGGGKSRKVAGFMAPAAQVDDPLGGVEYTGNVETDSAAELSALEEGFKQRRKDEDARFKAATDSEFWLAVCFRDREHKDAFLAAVGASRLGDKYLDGHALARLLGIALPD